VNYKRQLQSNSARLLICLGFILFLFYPFAHMVVNITPEDFNKVVNSVTFVPAILNTLKIAGTTTLISVPLGLLMAFAIQRTAIKMKTFWTVVLTLPMLIPSISHGMSLIVLFGTNGVLRNLFQIESTIYGFTGIIAGSVLYSYPVVFLMFNDVLKYQDSSPYEAAQVLGIPKFHTHMAITLPYLTKPLISAVFTVFSLVATDYGIPLMIGGKTTTLAVMMYQQVLGQLDFNKGGVIGLFLLIPAILAFVVNTVIKSGSKLSFVTTPFDIKKRKVRDGAAYAFRGMVSFCIVMLFGAFAAIAFSKRYPSNMALTFDHVKKMFALRGGTYLINSLIIAVFVAVIGIIVAFITAYMTARMPSKMSSVLHLFSITSLAIPGLVLGLSYAMTFGGSFIYGTLAILILANIMHFFASPYQMMYNSLSKMNENLESVGQTLGIGRVRMVLDVIIPQSRTTMLEMFSYFFVHSMMTISAVSFLSTVLTKPLSLLISQFEGQVLYECAAVVSLLIMLSNITVKILVYLINTYLVSGSRATAQNNRRK